jgi:Zn-dependent protease
MHLQIVPACINVLLLWILTAPHEFAHAWVATRLGDDTPMREGRVTLNPLVHIDWIGTTLLPFVTSLLSGGLIGWGRPVRTDTSKLKGGLNGLAVVALAGPLSNVVMAVLLGAIAVATRNTFPGFAQIAAQGVRLSLYLGLFNLLPVPPLDGSKLLLAARIPVKIYVEIARAGFMLLIVLMSFTSFGRWIGEWSYLGARAIFVALGAFTSSTT